MEEEEGNKCSFIFSCASNFLMLLSKSQVIFLTKSRRSSTPRRLSLDLDLCTKHAWPAPNAPGTWAHCRSPRPQTQRSTAKAAMRSNMAIGTFVITDQLNNSWYNLLSDICQFSAKKCVYYKSILRSQAAQARVIFPNIRERCHQKF